ncbi:cytochrome c oxidase subunit 4 [Pengzhenrongella frigida]|uniref:Cytochrome c oxidase polypeptide 4 n=1 Tax=Pengzhenrongella frigida TaxID=1259133 RepID=A0A4Q5MXC8_9MICO|nr:cytochrome c oxidase subunit 4 [Cellulomonas sp. HLT2-17]RYV50308.1 cytochrome c oxidase subunit 4 [Cellulomonas sp. HLT2-17]
MKVETRLFLWMAPFFGLCAAVYGFWSGWEPVGSAALIMVALLMAMIGAYFTLLIKRIDSRPEDDPLAEIEQGAGDQGVYSPWSWWPLVIALAAAIAFLGLAMGWWMLLIAIPVAVVGLCGWVFEFSTGQHAH